MTKAKTKPKVRRRTKVEKEEDKHKAYYYSNYTRAISSVKCRLAILSRRVEHFINVRGEEATDLMVYATSFPKGKQHELQDHAQALRTVASMLEVFNIELAKTEAELKAEKDYG